MSNTVRPKRINWRSVWRTLNAWYRRESPFCRWRAQQLKIHKLVDAQLDSDQSIDWRSLWRKFNKWLKEEKKRGEKSAKANWDGERKQIRYLVEEELSKKKAGDEELFLSDVPSKKHGSIDDVRRDNYHIQLAYFALDIEASEREAAHQGG